MTRVKISFEFIISVVVALLNSIRDIDRYLPFIRNFKRILLNANLFHLGIEGLRFGTFGTPQRR
jgi:hypothetical protein